MIKTSVQSSTFDLVHDTTAIYRILLHAMARPGTIGNISAYSDKLMPSLPGQRLALALSLTLLDQGTCFTIHMRSGEHIAETIQRQTFSRLADPDKADYLFIDGDLSDKELRHILEQTNAGTLLQPELGATLIVFVKELSVESVEAATLLLSGPGIRDINSCKIEGLSPVWLLERKRKIAEYPMGIDLIVLDQHGNIIAIPRTTQAEKGVAAWDMS